MDRRGHDADTARWGVLTCGRVATCNHGSLVAGRAHRTRAEPCVGRRETSQTTTPAAASRGYGRAVIEFAIAMGGWAGFSWAKWRSLCLSLGRSQSALGRLCLYKGILSSQKRKRNKKETKRSILSFIQVIQKIQRLLHRVSCMPTLINLQS